MWYVLDRHSQIVVCSVGTRAEAYKIRTQYAWMHPERKYKVERGF